MRAKHGKFGAGMLAAIVAGMLLPVTASAREPRITDPPEVTGDTTVAKTVTAGTYEYTGGRDTSVRWVWFRCTSLDEDDCSVISGAAAPSYTMTSADAGRRLRVMLFVRNDDGSAWSLSNPSAVVQGAPKPPPPPPPPPEPQPVAPPPPPVVTPPPPTSGVLDTQAVKKRKPSMMRPTPIVRIRGRTTPGGARITLLTVKAPRGARIALACRGRSCPVKRWAKATVLTRLLRFERVLAAGTKLTIKVTKPGRIGKYTEIVIRADKSPWRRDRCLIPGSSRPRSCPAA